MKHRFTMSRRTLSDLAAFEVVAEARSFTRAARTLGVSTSALSQTVRRLETTLEVRLLNRTTRSVSVSAAGVRLLAKLTPALASLSESVQELRASEGRLAGSLRINSTRMARHLLAPVLVEFQRRYPDVEVEICANDGLIDIVKEQFDAGVRLGISLEKDMVALPLRKTLQGWYVAAPSYARLNGLPSHPRELLQHKCIVLLGPTHGAPIAWQFEKGRQSLEVTPRGPLRVSDLELGLEAARCGAGIALAFDVLVREDVQRGRLTRVLASWTPPPVGVSLYYPSRKQSPAPLQAFVELLKAHNRQALAKAMRQ